MKTIVFEQFAPRLKETKQYFREFSLNLHCIFTENVHHFQYVFLMNMQENFIEFTMYIHQKLTENWLKNQKYYQTFTFGAQWKFNENAMYFQRILNQIFPKYSHETKWNKYKNAMKFHCIFGKKSRNIHWIYTKYPELSYGLFTEYSVKFQWKNIVFSFSMNIL